MHYANLHMHSTFSDGGFTPSQLILLGKSLGYGALALTDHETDGGSEEFLKAARLEGMDAIPGVEFSVLDNGHGFHIVSLDHDLNHPRMRKFIRLRCELYAEGTRKIVERGLELGYIHDITWNDILDDSEEGMWICIDQVLNAMRRRHIIPRMASEQSRLCEKLFHEPESRALRSRDPSAEEVISVIREAGGIAVLAHPFNQTQYVSRLVDLGLNGIEISHPHLYQYGKFAVEAAETYHLYRSGGTDHTGVMSGCNGTNAIPALQGISMDDYLAIKERRLG